MIDLETGRATGADQGCAVAHVVRVEDGRVWLGLASPDVVAAAPKAAVA